MCAAHQFGVSSNEIGSLLIIVCYAALIIRQDFNNSCSSAFPLNPFASEVFPTSFGDGQAWQAPCWKLDQGDPTVRNMPFSAHSSAGVYILPFIPIFLFIKKMPFLADFIKNWVHFINNSVVISLVIYQSQPKLYWTIRYKALWKYICI